eukprot:TRINITY_DN4840_c0_g1_i2.p1 TRINITY_DN4840_c0_g1~~TRINITY_DN4840_c0_g1_i2.p1  ORF type:complete len:241 (-),score=51.18 TRINITY_DN4840_c0_g1_i2:158-880(-)
MLLISGFDCCHDIHRSILRWLFWFGFYVAIDAKDTVSYLNSRFEMVSHNNAIHNQHFRKDWDKRVKTWFDQAARKKRRRLNRARKAAAIAPRPAAGPLRPTVHGQTIRYNQKLKIGRGFSLQELKEAKVTPGKARTIGIAVDVRRINRSNESLQRNAQRLKEYLAKLVVIKKTDKTAYAQSTAKNVIPFTTYQTAAFETRKITAEEKKKSVFESLRQARADARNIGKKLNPKVDAVGEKK